MHMYYQAHVMAKCMNLNRTSDHKAGLEIEYEARHTSCTLLRSLSLLSAKISVKVYNYMYMYAYDIQITSLTHVYIHGRTYLASRTFLDPLRTVFTQDTMPTRLECNNCAGFTDKTLKRGIYMYM